MATRPVTTGAPAGASAIAAPLSRRAALASVFAVPAIAAMPALAIADSTPFRRAHARFLIARDALNTSGDLELHDLAAYERLEAAYGDAADALEVTPCATWDELVDAIGAAYGDRVVIPVDVAQKLHADARRLAGRH